MTRPLGKGDVCKVINGVGRQRSPHLGKIVIVESLQGEHSTLGRIWRCTGKDLTAYNQDEPGTMGYADFAADWLQRIDPPPVAPKVVERDIEMS